MDEPLIAEAAPTAKSPSVRVAAAIDGHDILRKLSSESFHRWSSGEGAYQRSPKARRESGETIPFGLLEGPISIPTTPQVCGSEERRLPSGEFRFSAASADVVMPSSPPEVLELPDDMPVAKNSISTFFKKLLAFTGPGWLMSIAYVDPGNLEADVQSGAQFGYMLLWALLSATFVGLGMQLVAARLGCTTKHHLAEHCREHYSGKTRIVLWLLTELAIIGSDIQEVIGCSVGLELLFGLPLSLGVIITAAAAFGFLFLERLGTRPLEMFFGVLILVLALSMGMLFTEIKPDTGAVLDGLLVPRMPPSAVQQVVGMVGCVIMPHNLFLHSALVQSRVIEPGEEREAIVFYTIESSAAIFVSLLINACAVAVFAKGFYGTEDAPKIGLRNAGDYLGEAYGAPLRVIWALGLVAAGQSSTMTGAYSGQWVMQGFLQLQVKPWKRAIITRSMALVPTLTVAIYFGDGHSGLDKLNENLNVLQSLVLPFATVPLLLFAGTRNIMGSLTLNPCALFCAWVALFLVMAANIYLFIEGFAGDKPPGSMGVGNLIGLGSFITVYLGGLAYIAWAPRDSLKACK